MTEELEKRLLAVEEKTPIKSDVELKKALDEIIAAEMKKSLSKANAVLISECVEMILHIDNVESATVSERGKEAVERTLKNICDMKQSKRKKLWQIPRWGKIVVILILCVGIISSIQLGSMSSNGNLLDNVTEWGKRLYVALMKNDIDAPEKDNFILAASQTKEYKSIEAFIKTEKIQITVPKYMPNDLKIQTVIYDTSGENREISVIYDEDITLLIYIDVNLIPNNYEEIADILFIVNDTEYLIHKNIQQIIWINDDNTYILVGDFERDEFIKIIESLY